MMSDRGEKEGGQRCSSEKGAANGLMHDDECKNHPPSKPRLGAEGGVSCVV